MGIGGSGWEWEGMTGGIADEYAGEEDGDGEGEGLRDEPAPVLEGGGTKPKPLICSRCSC